MIRESKRKKFIDRLLVWEGKGIKKGGCTIVGVSPFLSRNL
jgi:hypothetical protein